MNESTNGQVKTRAIFAIHVSTNSKHPAAYIQFYRSELHPNGQDVLPTAEEKTELNGLQMYRIDTPTRAKRANAIIQAAANGRTTPPPVWTPKSSIYFSTRTGFDPEDFITAVDMSFRKVRSGKV